MASAKSSGKAKKSSPKAAKADAAQSPSIGEYLIQRLQDHGVRDVCKRRSALIVVHFDRSCGAVPLQPSEARDPTLPNPLEVNP
mgnify:CR=1 FL=1